MRSYRKIHRYKKKKSIIRNRFFWLVLLIVLSAVSLFYFLFLSDFFQIKKVVVTGQEKVSGEHIESLIPSGNVFFVDEDGIREKILDYFSQIAEVEISRSFPDSLNIVVVERVPAAVFCQQEQCFLVDSGGVAFEKISAEDRNQMVLIENSEGEKPALGDELIGEDSLSKILKIESDLGSGLKVEAGEFTILPDRLSARTYDGWDIYFSLANDVDWQITKLGAVLEEKIPQEERGNLEYIDLRFGNLAPYKYRD